MITFWQWSTKNRLLGYIIEKRVSYTDTAIVAPLIFPDLCVFWGAIPTNWKTNVGIKHTYLKYHRELRWWRKAEHLYLYLHVYYTTCIQLLQLCRISYIHQVQSWWRNCQRIHSLFSEGPCYSGTWEIVPFALEAVCVCVCVCVCWPYTI